MSSPSSRRKRPRKRAATTQPPFEELFDQLGGGFHDPRLRNASGSVRVDVREGKRTNRWFLTVDHGHVRVSRKSGRADAVVRADRETFQRALAGELNLMAAVLRGDVTLEGDTNVLVLVQRLVPRSGGGLAGGPRSEG